MFVYLINRNGLDLRTALLATGYMFVVFVLYHSSRIPWLWYQHKDEGSPTKVVYGILGLLFVGFALTLTTVTAVWFYTMQPPVYLTERVPDTRDAKILQLNNQLTQLRSSHESRDSLRKRILRVADALDAFNKQRMGLRMQVPDIRDANGKATELIKFDTETTALYVSSGLKAKTVEIIREIKQKGLDTGFLEMWAQQGAIQGGMFPMWNNNDSALPLREYAFHFDANGNVLRIDY